MRSADLDLYPAHAAPTGVVLAQASRGDEAAAPWLVFDGRRLQRLIDELEARGVRRRSDQPGGK